MFDFMEEEEEKAGEETSTEAGGNGTLVTVETVQKRAESLQGSSAPAYFDC